jgi:hypothetical protein
MTLVEYYNSVAMIGIKERELESSIHSKHQLLRMLYIITELQGDTEIDDIVIYKDKTESESSRSKPAFIYVLMNYGKIKSRKNETVVKLESIGKKFKSARDKHTVREFLMGGENINNDIFPKQTFYYCGKDIAEHIDENFASLGLSKDGLAMYYLLLAVEDYSFKEAGINNEISRLIRKFDKKLKRRLED